MRTIWKLLLVEGPILFKEQLEIATFGRRVLNLIDDYKIANKVDME